MARRESNRVMVLKGRSARNARKAFTLWVLLPAGHASSMIILARHELAVSDAH